jgi:hypothetical protein
MTSVEVQSEIVGEGRELRTMLQQDAGDHWAACQGWRQIAGALVG